MSGVNPNTQTLSLYLWKCLENLISMQMINWLQWKVTLQLQWLRLIFPLFQDGATLLWAGSSHYFGLVDYLISCSVLLFIFFLVFLRYSLYVARLFPPLRRCWFHRPGCVPHFLHSFVKCHLLFFTRCDFTGVGMQGLSYPTLNLIIMLYFTISCNVVRLID